MSAEQHDGARDAAIDEILRVRPTPLAELGVLDVFLKMFAETEALQRLQREANVTELHKLSEK